MTDKEEILRDVVDRGYLYEEVTVMECDITFMMYYLGLLSSNGFIEGDMFTLTPLAFEAVMQLKDAGYYLTDEDVDFQVESLVSLGYLLEEDKDAFRILVKDAKNAGIEKMREFMEMIKSDEEE